MGTKIDWADELNVTLGCSKVSEGCEIVCSLRLRGD